MRKLHFISLFALFSLLLSCSSNHKNRALNPKKDYHSFANTDEVVLTHINLRLNINFDTHVIHGFNTIRYKNIKTNAKQLILDTKDLTIISVSHEDNYNYKPLKWRFGEKDELLGQALIIDLPETNSPIYIEYLTSPDATGLQWVEPVQTMGGHYPFLYSQSEAIGARSWIPLQDTPQVRQTYAATVTANKNVTITMSAYNSPRRYKNIKKYRFKMEQPIPSYLIAIAAGKLKYKAISQRSGVWAEREILEQAAYEFEDTEKMIQAGEKLYGKYEWQTYDLLILPPSFPFGGMENPRLSFITPTSIAGDKSLTSLIAHELAHSWSGNLVTNATWRDLWLNEGFTTYFESRITEVVNGKAIKDMEAVLAYQSLMAEMPTLPKKYQSLALDLRGEDPDDAFSDIPYTKGRMMLDWLEASFGREKFDAFITSYFHHFAFQSITTEQFLAYLDENLIKKYPKTVTLKQVKQWIYQPGIPKTAVIPHTDIFKKIDQQSQSWLNDEINLANMPTKTWVTQQWIYFIKNLPKNLNKERLIELDQAFDLSHTKNTEIAHVWFMQSIQHGYKVAFPAMKAYLIKIGRRKLIRPLYEELVKTPENKKWAQNVYKIARPHYQKLAQVTMDKIFAGAK